MSPVRELNLVDIGLVSILIYLLIALIRPALRPRTSTPAQRPSTDYQAIPKKHPQCLVYKKFTPRELAKYDGKRKDGEGRLLLAIQRRMKAKDEKEERGWREVRLERTVFDVTSGAGFYGPDGPYGNFAGRDASRGMAKQSFDEDMLTPLDQPLDTLDGFTMDEIDNMQSWHGHFVNKYIVCGELVEDPMFAAG
ncbi:cytochrome b5 [Filobasidium floriforme]|uniref:cytochrome b5 n=1 Tax=Filobasidium floriforme TaxID=5210 RepID=UPI001E8EB66C|nr:cytochrome b5 [Filobasidium floriforme]KAH8080077.1 cytochrome b5 [Filobasidium floriforme]